MAICAPLLAVGSRLRVATILILLVGTIGFGRQRPLVVLQEWVRTSTAPTERAAVVKLLDAHPDLPYVAQYWASIFDVVYLRDKEGTWLYEGTVNSLQDKDFIPAIQDRDFIAVINDVLTDKTSPFFKSVEATCEPLTPDARVISTYRCSKGFWSGQSYRGRDNSTNSDIGIPYPGAVDKKDCDVVGGWVIDKKTRMHS